MRTRCYPSDLTDAQWALVAPHIPAAKSGGRPRTTDVRAMFDAIIYLLRTGCQLRQFPGDFPPWPTVHGYSNRVEPANMSDRRAGGRLLAGLAPLWPIIRTVIADAGHESSKLARQLLRDGWNLQIVKRKQRAFKVAGLARRQLAGVDSLRNALLLVFSSYSRP